MYRRKTEDEYEIQGNYGQGWEVVTTEITLREAKAQLKCYNENETNAHRIIKKRTGIGSQAQTLKAELDRYDMFRLQN